MSRQHFWPELTFYTYPHKLQNISFNLAVQFCMCSQGLGIYYENKCVPDFWVTLYIRYLYPTDYKSEHHSLYSNCSETHLSCNTRIRTLPVPVPLSLFLEAMSYPPNNGTVPYTRPVHYPYPLVESISVPVVPYPYC
jgi:hypothetical protein